MMLKNISIRLGLAGPALIIALFSSNVWGFDTEVDYDQWVGGPKATAPATATATDVAVHPDSPGPATPYGAFQEAPLAVLPPDASPASQRLLNSYGVITRQMDRLSLGMEKHGELTGLVQAEVRARQIRKSILHSCKHPRLAATQLKAVVLKTVQVIEATRKTPLRSPLTVRGPLNTYFFPNGNVYISYSDLCDPLGAGRFKTAWEALDYNHGTRVAFISGRFNPSSIEDFIDLNAEEDAVRNGDSIDHPNIVHSLDHQVRSESATEMRLELFQPLLAGGTLERVVFSRDSDLLRIARKLFSALNKIHRVGFVHRDLKPDNILLDEKGNPIIADLGLLKSLAPDSLGQIGKLNFALNPFAIKNESEGKPIFEGSAETAKRIDVMNLGQALYFVKYREQDPLTKMFHGAFGLTLNQLKTHFSANSLPAEIVLPPGNIDWATQTLGEIRALAKSNREESIVAKTILSTVYNALMSEAKHEYERKKAHVASSGTRAEKLIFEMMSPNLSEGQTTEHFLNELAE